MQHPIKAPNLHCPKLPRDGASWLRWWGKLEHYTNIEWRMVSFIDLLEAFERHRDLSEAPVPSHPNSAKWLEARD